MKEHFYFNDIMCCVYIMTVNDTGHKKTDVKVFVVVIPKERLVDWGHANPSLGMTPTVKYYSTAFIDYIL